MLREETAPVLHGIALRPEGWDQILPAALPGRMVAPRLFPRLDLPEIVQGQTLVGLRWGGRYWDRIGR